MKTEGHRNSLIQPMVLLVLLVVLLILMFSGHWGPVTRVPDISPGEGVIYEGTNPPKEMLTDPRYVWGRIKIDDVWV